MRISRDKYLNDLVARKGNGMVKVVTKGDVRRAKLYYLRERHGKAAKIKEHRSGKSA